jgi:type IV pilus assembly protein PilP
VTTVRTVAAVVAVSLVGLARPLLAAEADTSTSTPSASGTADASRASRDPFRPFTLSLRPPKATSPKTPLQQYDLGSLSLVAIIWGSSPKAMVEDQSGLGYTIGVGTPIGQSGGVVKAIEPDKVVVEEEFVDFYGEKKKSETVLKLKPEGEKRP